MLSRIFKTLDSAVLGSERNSTSEEGKARKEKWIENERKERNKVKQSDFVHSMCY